MSGDPSRGGSLIPDCGIIIDSADGISTDFNRSVPLGGILVERRLVLRRGKTMARDPRVVIRGTLPEGRIARLAAFGIPRNMSEAVPLRAAVHVERGLVLRRSQAMPGNPAAVPGSGGFIPDGGVAGGSADVISVNVFGSVALRDVRVEGLLVLRRGEPVPRNPGVRHGFLPQSGIARVVVPRVPGDVAELVTLRGPAVKGLLVLRRV